MPGNQLARGRYSSPLLISVDHDFDREIAEQARVPTIKIYGKVEILIGLFERLWRGEEVKNSVYSVFHTDVYMDWAKAVNRLLEKKKSDSPNLTGDGS